MYFFTVDTIDALSEIFLGIFLKSKHLVFRIIFYKLSAGMVYSWFELQ